ncbi:hypothetical protein L0Y65_01670 [Candidatus Micrarchaeota archaeon]|nr:hypothetical protein [Candidatus Micrarchaeota archaeon]
MNALRIPLIYLRDKQAFRKEGGMLRLIGKPLDFAKDAKKSGCQLIHIIDTDALSGLQNNLDVYDGLTYIINVEVECAPSPVIVMKLLSLKCRVVVPPSADIASMKEKKLLVAKIPAGYGGDADGFHDVILEDADDSAVMRFATLGKRVIIHEKDENKMSGKTKGKIFGIITSS